MYVQTLNNNKKEITGDLINVQINQFIILLFYKNTDCALIYLQDKILKL